MNRMCASCSTKLLVAAVIIFSLFFSGGCGSQPQQNDDETIELKKLKQALAVTQEFNEPYAKETNSYTTINQINKAYCDIINYHYDNGNMDEVENYIIQYINRANFKASCIAEQTDALVDYYCSKNRYENAAQFLKKLDNPYIVTKFYLNRMGDFNKASEYLEKKISTIGQEKDFDWNMLANAINEISRSSRTYEEYKKWWTELHNVRIKYGRELLGELIDYYIHTGQIDKAIEEKNKISPSTTNTDIAFVTQYKEADGTAMGMYYWSRRLPLSAKFQKQEEIFEKYPNCKFNRILLKEMIETAKELNENDKAIHYADILKEITNQEYANYLRSFPEPSAWSLGDEVINEKYNREIGAVKKIDINADGLLDEMISFLLSPKGELEKGYVIPIVRIKREDTYENVFVGPMLGYPSPLGKHKDDEKEPYSYSKKDPIDFFNITGGELLDIVVYTEASHSGEVGWREDKYSIYQHTDTDGYKLAKVFSGSHAADGGEWWITRIEFMKNPDTLRCDVVKVNDTGQCEWENGRTICLHKKKSSTYAWENGEFYLVGETSETIGEFSLP